MYKATLIDSHERPRIEVTAIDHRTRLRRGEAVIQEWEPECTAAAVVEKLQRHYGQRLELALYRWGYGVKRCYVAPL